MIKFLLKRTPLFALGYVVSAMAIIEGARQRLGATSDQNTAGSAFGGVEVIRAKYKFSEDGGAVGTIGLMDAANVPANFVAYNGWVDVIVAPTSGGSATVAVQLEAANDIINAAAISGAPWSTTGRKAIIPVGAATSVKTTAARNISAVIGTAALTAGEFDVYLIGVRTS